MPGGRPSLLCEDLVERAEKLMPTLLYVESLAPLLGIDRFTLRLWCKRGRVEQRKRRNPRYRPRAEEELYLRFMLAVEKGVAAGELSDLANIRKVADGGCREVETQEITRPDGTVEKRTLYEHAAPNWTASAWRLERRHPGRWGRRDRHEVTGAGGAPLFVFAEIVPSVRPGKPAEVLENGQAGDNPNQPGGAPDPRLPAPGGGGDAEG